VITPVNIGAAPNDGTGDLIRTAFGKVNTNYNWITSKIGADDQAVTLGGNIGKRYLDMTAANDTWEDLQFPITTLNPIGVGNPATVVATSGQSGLDLALQYTTNNTLYAFAQMPHTWTVGTDIFPHIHVQPQLPLANTIVWNGWYSIAQEGDLFPVSTAFGPFNTNIPAGNQWRHLTLKMPPGGISLAGMTDQVAIRFKFQVVSATNPFHVLSFDVHYRWGGSPITFTP